MAHNPHSQNGPLNEHDAPGLHHDRRDVPGTRTCVAESSASAVSQHSRPAAKSQVKDKKFLAHRLVMSCCSRWLAALLYDHEKDDVVKLDELDPGAFERIIAYAYGEPLDVPLEDAGKLITVPPPTSHCPPPPPSSLSHIPTLTFRPRFCARWKWRNWRAGAGTT